MMSVISFGDMASTLRNMRATSVAKQQLHQAGQEISTGLKADLRQSVSGNFAPLSHIDRSLRTLSSYSYVIIEAGHIAQTMQNGLETIANHVSQSGASLITASALFDTNGLSIQSNDSASRLESVINTLNTRANGRAIYSGQSTSQAPFTSADDLMNDVLGAIAAAGAVNANDMMTVIDTWFDDPSGGFATTSYLGSTSPRSPLHISESDVAKFEFTANDDSIRQVLKGLVAGAVVSQSALPSFEEKSKLMQYAGQTLLGAEAQLSKARANIGTLQERVEEVSVANQARRFGFEAAKSEIVSADIYEASTRLNQAEVQLDLVYSITARMSRLSLADYI